MTDRGHITNRTDNTCDGIFCTDPDTRRRRALFRSWHRGTQELDLLLGSFADGFIARFDGSQLALFEALLDCHDVELLDWITGRCAPPQEYDHEVMRLLRTSRLNQKG